MDFSLYSIKIKLIIAFVTIILSSFHFISAGIISSNSDFSGKSKKALELKYSGVNISIVLGTIIMYAAWQYTCNLILPALYFAIQVAVILYTHPLIHIVLGILTTLVLPILYFSKGSF